jgi:hypothetical protein
MVTLLDGIGSSKVILLYNDLFKSTDASFTEREEFAEWLLTFDYASGHANARSNVIAIDSYSVSHTDHVARADFYRDDPPLHFNPFGAKFLAELLHARLIEVYGDTYTNLPPQVVLPADDDTIFIHTNPNMNPGGNGTVIGTWGTPPSNTTVPSGWQISPGSNAGGITGVLDKTLTDGDGNPQTELVLSGTLGAGLATTIQLLQAAQVADRLTLNDVLRAVARVEVEAGSECLHNVSLRVFVTADTATKNRASTSISGDTTTAEMVLANGTWDAAFSGLLATQIIDLQDPNMDVANDGPGLPSSLGSTQVILQIQFANKGAETANIAATVRLSQCGLYQVS